MMAFEIRLTSSKSFSRTKFWVLMASRSAESLPPLKHASLKVRPMMDVVTPADNDLPVKWVPVYMILGHVPSMSCISYWFTARTASPVWNVRKSLV